MGNRFLHKPDPARRGHRVLEGNHYLEGVNMKVLIASPEIFPFVKTGGLADVTGASRRRSISWAPRCG